jgi:gamma-glutamyltranspeptidase
MESHAPPAWLDGLQRRGHHVRVIGAFNPVDVGCSQILAVDAARGHFVGAADPRSPDGDAIGR